MWTSHIYKANVHIFSKKYAIQGEKMETWEQSCCSIKAVSIEKDRAILPCYLWQAYGVKIILWRFSSLYSPLLHWDPDNRLCFEPHTLGKPKAAMDSNRQAPTYNATLVTNSAQTPGKLSSTPPPHVLKTKSFGTRTPWVSSVLQTQGTDTALEWWSGGGTQVKGKKNSSFLSESLNAPDNEESAFN